MRKRKMATVPYWKTAIFPDAKRVSSCSGGLSCRCCSRFGSTGGRITKNAQTRLTLIVAGYTVFRSRQESGFRGDSFVLVGIFENRKIFRFSILSHWIYSKRIGKTERSFGFPFNPAESVPGVPAYRMA